MIWIELKDIMLTARHGIFDGEELAGNPYIINLKVMYDEGAANFENIGNTINYADLFALVTKNMNRREGLLEKVCVNIMDDVQRQYPFSKEADISIYKLQAPIEGLQGKVGVRLTRKFNG